MAKQIKIFNINILRINIINDIVHLYIDKYGDITLLQMLYFIIEHFSFLIDKQLDQTIRIFVLFRNVFQSEFNSFHFADFSKLIIKSKNTKRPTHEVSGEIGIRR